jgi:hypothetical protein
MVLIPVLCPHCHSDQVIKGGKTKAGQQRYSAKTAAAPIIAFSLIFSTKDMPLQSKSRSSTCVSMAAVSAIRHGC